VPYEGQRISNTNGQAQNLTPNNEVSGAIHAVVAHPTDANVMYVGTVNGGIWRTNNATAANPTWTPLTDFEDSLSIGALEMDPGTTQILLAGVGRFSSFGGDPPFQLAGGNLSGLYRTTDGGSTWTLINDPLLAGEHVSAVASRGNILLAGANNFFGGGGTGGLFRTTDTGATWTQITGGAGTGGNALMPNGMFKVALRPGRYWIGAKEKALDPVKYVPGEAQFSEMVVEVKPGSFASVELTLTGYAP
jgi:hypothetical protein